MSAEATPHGVTDGTEDFQAAFTKMLEEMRLLQESIERHRAQAEVSRDRTEVIWRDIDRLREETRPLMAEIRTLL